MASGGGLRLRRPRPNTGLLDGIARRSTSAASSITDAQFRTNVSGVFAAGDVRAGSTKQLASAVGEGAAVAIQVRYHLDDFARV